MLKSPRLLLAFAAVVVLGLVAAASASASPTVWLCRPGVSPDPCTPGLSTTVYTPTQQPVSVNHPTAVKSPKIDCFYVYPTVSDETGPLSDLSIDPEEKSIALYQAARYSQYCKVYAPMYRQITVPQLESSGTETAAQLAVPLQDVENAFHNYLTKFNHGRGFILIGHSQGSFLLRELIAKEIDPKPAVRKRLVSAILMGGNVQVKTGTGIGGDFQHIPACTSATQLGCVIAFSTFDQTPPAGSLFGRTTTPGDSVLCVNPASLAGNGILDPIFPSAPFAPGTLIALGIQGLHLTQPTPSTVWSSEPGAYSATCSSAAGADVLLVTPRNGAQTPTPSPDPTWGLHLVDANIALGNLITIVSRESEAFAQRGAAPARAGSRVE